MNRLNDCLTTLVLLIGTTLVSNPMAAQATAKATTLPIVNGQMVGAVPYGCVAPETGDGLWNVGGKALGNPLRWPEFFSYNPYLKEPGRVTVKNGVTFVLIRRTEKYVELLCGLDKMGIAPKLATPAEMQALGLNLPTQTITVTKFSPWSWLLPLIILALFALVLLALYAWFRRDPTRVGAGRVREEGLQTPQEAAEHVRNQIAQENGFPAARVRIISMVRGRAYGWARIGDRLGSFFGRLLHGQEAWEVTAQLPNGQQVIRYTLLACANDVRGGGGMIPGWGFRFVPGANVTAEVQPVVVPAPTPVPAPTATEHPAAPEVQTPTPSPASTRAATLPDGMVRFEFKRATDGQPNVVRLQGVSPEDFFFETGPTATTFRYREVPKELAPAPAPTAPEANAN